MRITDLGISKPDNDRSINLDDLWKNGTYFVRLWIGVSNNLNLQSDEVWH